MRGLGSSRAGGRRIQLPAAHSSQPLHRADRSRAAGFLQVRPRTGTGGQRDREGREGKLPAFKTKPRRPLPRDLSGVTSVLATQA